MANTGGDEAWARARAAIARVGTSLSAGALPDPASDRDLAELAACMDSQLWEPGPPGTWSP